MRRDDATFAKRSSRSPAINAGALRVSCLDLELRSFDRCIEIDAHYLWFVGGS
jgi:hypothetical protein